LPANRLQQWATYPVFSKLNEITPVLQMSVTNHQGSAKKNFPLKLKIKAVSLIRFSNLVILNTVSSQVLIAVCKCLFRNPNVVVFFIFNRPTDLNFNMNKKRGTLFNFGVKKSRIEGVCDATNNDSSTSSLQSDLQDVQKEDKTTSTQWKSMHSLLSTWAAI